MQSEGETGEGMLLPCPFCGGNPQQSFTRATDTFAFWSVECSQCCVEIADDERQAAADAHWNTRPPAPEDAETVERALADPSAVHINMLRGAIAKPDPASIWHIYGDEALISAMPESARAALAALSRFDGETGK